MPRHARRLSRSPLLAACAAVVTAGLALQLAVGSATAAPPLPPNPVAIEPLAGYVPQTTCSPTIKPGTAAMRSVVEAAYPGTGDLGIVRDCAIGGTSEHKEGRAWDWAVNSFDVHQDAAARDFFAWLFATDADGNTYAMARRLGIMYLIYNRHIWGAYDPAGGWRPYTGPNPHTDHVHISLGWPGADRTTSYWVDAGPEHGTPPTGAFLTSWSGLGGSGGPLGAPTSAQYAVAGGRAQDFQGGRIYSSAAGGTHAVYGAIFQTFVRLGAVGALGLPVSDEGPVPGGRVSSFQGGRVFWSPTTGAHAVVGMIGQRYDRLGGPGGALGLPTDDEQAAGTGRVSAFQGGRMYWSLATGPQVVQGAIGVRYLALGGPAGPLGMPVGDESAVRGGRLSAFQGGRIYWSPTTGPQVVTGSIGARYDALGGPDGMLGLPVRDEQDAGTGRVSSFQGGALYWSLATGTQLVYGAVQAHHDLLGGGGGPLGLPVGELGPITPVVQMQPFQGGRVYVQAGIALSVRGLICQTYVSLGGVLGTLGAPTSSEYDVAGGRRSDFTGGHLTWTAATGQVTRD